MALEQTHPELASEQTYIDEAYRWMDLMYHEVAGFAAHGRNDFELEAFERWKLARMAALSDQVSALVFGRLDSDEAETFYIGRHHVWGERRKTMVVDWRAPVAKAFYRASTVDPMGLVRRRQYLQDGRVVLGISDDAFTGPDALRGIDGIRGGAVLQAELGRQRAGEMRDIVATIQAEQDVIIRAPLEGIVVVQGGPGTGKTAIGLHRASFLLYEHREHLSRSKVLVVGPNPTFMRYIAKVLPALGETAVTQRTIHELAPLVRAAGRDDRDAQRIKGDARLATVISKAIQQRSRPMTQDVVLRVQGATLTLSRHEVGTTTAHIRASSPPHKQGRTMTREQLMLSLYRQYQARLREGSSPVDVDTFSRGLRADGGFKAVLDAVWPAVAPTTLVRELLTKPPVLATAAEGILTPDEQRAVVRKRGAREAWSDADRALLDEAHAQIEGAPDRYGHVIVDEAQDLSPMQIRMLARRTKDGSMTILGDLGQATGAWAHDRWGEVLEHLDAPGGSRVEELTLGYRVSPAIMKVATSVLRVAAPGLHAPSAVRAEQGNVHIAALDEASFGATVARLAVALKADVGFAAVIAPDGEYERVRRAMAAADVTFGEATRDGLTNDLTLVATSGAKGLEFDGVVLVEPAAIVAEDGLRMLYIAITRAMRSLVIAHHTPLPDALTERLGADPAA
jgi:DNA helicase IV